MFGRLFRRETGADAIAATLYGAIVAQARNPIFYEELGVPDTVSGRFEMVVLHVVLVLEQLEDRDVGQRIFDLYCKDMDQSLRELGVGDLGVPKRMKKMAEAFYGRSAAYRSALSARDSHGLATAIARNVFDHAEAPARLVSAYAIASANLLAGMNPLVETLRFAPVGAAVEVVA
jgi:cytochrome b pre-mRNA-processing protein 3